MTDINAYSGDVSAERIKSGNVTGSGVKIQFKSPGLKNLGSEKPLDKNVSHLWLNSYEFCYDCLMIVSEHLRVNSLVAVAGYYNSIWNRSVFSI